MKFWSVGMSFHEAPLDMRTKALLIEKKISELRPLADEFVWVSTCNRLEVYGVGGRGPEEVLENWCQIVDLSKVEQSHFQIFRDGESLSHLFKVTSSLESMVIGETQITGQVKRAYDEAAKQGWLGPALHRAFQRAFRAAKKVRAQTELGRLSVSLPSVAVKLAEKILGNLETKKILILGLGEIGRNAAEHFGSVQPRELILWNRTKSVAEEMGRELRAEGSSVRLVEDYQEAARESDVIVSTASANLLNESDLRSLDQLGKPAVIIDLSVPPSVELPSGTSFSNLYVFRVDDLQNVARENSALRVQEMERALGIINHEVKAFFSGLETSDMNQTFQRLSDKVQSITDAELRELQKRLPGVDPKSWDEIQKMANRLSSKILQDPTLELRSRLQTDESEGLLAAFRSLFRI